MLRSGELQHGALMAAESDNVFTKQVTRIIHAKSGTEHDFLGYTPQAAGLEGGGRNA